MSGLRPMAPRIDEGWTPGGWTVVEGGETNECWSHEERKLQVLSQVVARADGGRDYWLLISGDGDVKPSDEDCEFTLASFSMSWAVEVIDSQTLHRSRAFKLTKLPHPAGWLTLKPQEMSA